MRRIDDMQELKVVELMAKNFARFLNRVENSGNDMLGSLLIESEWEQYIDDAEEVMEKLETAGFVVAPKEPTDPMYNNADASPSKGRVAQGARGMRVYFNAVWRAMLSAWQQTRDIQLVTDILSMALARASDPAAKRNPASFTDSSFRRYAKNSADIINDVDKNGFAILPDEPTPTMIAAAVRQTAEKAENVKAIGADPAYLKSIYDNMVKVRPASCRPKGSAPSQPAPAGRR